MNPLSCSKVFLEALAVPQAKPPPELLRERETQVSDLLLCRGSCHRLVEQLGLFLIQNCVLWEELCILWETREGLERRKI